MLTIKKCVNNDSDTLLDAAPTKGVLLSTSADIRRMMKRWVISGEDEHWKVELDIRDLGGHLDTTLRGRAGTMSGRIWKEMFNKLLLGH